MNYKTLNVSFSKFEDKTFTTSAHFNRPIKLCMQRIVSYQNFMLTLIQQLLSISAMVFTAICWNT